MTIFLANIIFKNLDTKLNGLKVITRTTKIGVNFINTIEAYNFRPYPTWDEACFQKEQYSWIVGFMPNYKGMLIYLGS
jgi:hypothetical protein